MKDYLLGVCLGFVIGALVAQIFYARLLDRCRTRWIEALNLVDFWKKEAQYRDATRR